MGLINELKIPRTLPKLFIGEPGANKPVSKRCGWQGYLGKLIFYMYLLKFDEGHEIPPHKDNLEVGRHFSLNIRLKHPTLGGDFKCEKTLFETRSMKFFRPDICEHSVGEIVHGKRYGFSLGWVRS